MWNLNDAPRSGRVLMDTKHMCVTCHDSTATHPCAYDMHNTMRWIPHDSQIYIQTREESKHCDVLMCYRPMVYGNIHMILW
jgi:cytochrome c peroxidase